MDTKIVQNIYSRHTGSEILYQRSYCKNLVYTEGILDFQQTLQAIWVIDTIISHLSKIMQTYKATKDGFFVATISVKADNTAVFEIFREGYENRKYNEHITVINQNIQFTDLPEYEYKFYLILSSYNPIIFTLMLPNEY